MKPAARSGLVVLLGTFVVVLAIALPALAYQYPLSSVEIRDAFFLGIRNDDLTAALFAKYSRTLPVPETGAYVAEIDLDTPYLQVARRAKGAVNYGAPDAVAAIFPLWGTDGNGPPPSPIGGRIDVDYDPEKIDTADAMVEVLTPDGQDIVVPFDLSRLQ